MNTLGIAARSLWRRRVRSALTAGGVAFAVAVLVSLFAFDAGYRRALRNDIDRMGYQLLVTAKGCPYEAATLMLKGGGGMRYMDQAVHDRIVGDERVEEIAQQLVVTVFDESADEGAGGVTMYVGVDDAYRRLRPWLSFRSGGWFSGGDTDEAVMGYEAAELEQRSVGDEIYVAKIDRVFRVVGILERTGSQDDGVVFLPLRTAQSAFEYEGQISGVGIRLKDLSQITAFEEDLYDEPGIQVVSMAQVRGTILNLMSSARVLAGSIAAVAVVVAVIGVVNTILMSVLERTKQIGMMKALGASRLDVFRIVWLETALVCLLGGVGGAALAAIGGRFAEHVARGLLPYAPGGTLVSISPLLVLGALAGAVLIGLVAGVYPAWRAATLRPVEAIRRAES